MNQKILVVGDGGDPQDPLKSRLESEGFDVLAAPGASRAFEAATAERPDLVILDVRLSLREELEVCRRIRREAAMPALPILLVCGRGEPVEMILSAENGVDDFMTRPYDPPELVTRVKVLLRRAARPAEVVKAGAIALDRERYQVTVDSKPVQLTSKEFELLLALLDAGGRVVRREALLERVWSYDREAGVESRTLDVHIRSLRKKLGGEGGRIVTVRTVGYRISLSPEWILFGSRSPRSSH